MPDKFNADDSWQTLPGDRRAERFLRPERAHGRARRLGRQANGAILRSPHQKVADGYVSKVAPGASMPPHRSLYEEIVVTWVATAPPMSVRGNRGPVSSSGLRSVNASSSCEEEVVVREKLDNERALASETYPTDSFPLGVVVPLQALIGMENIEARFEPEGL